MEAQTCSFKTENEFALKIIAENYILMKVCLFLYFMNQVFET